MKTGLSLSLCVAEILNHRNITRPLHEEIDCLKAELDERDAMLCGVLTALARADGYVHTIKYAEYNRPGDAVCNWYDETETGVSYDAVLEWFTRHQRRDAERRTREAAELEARKIQALRKLTLEERILLGLPDKLD
jgi:hypothetical protein